MLRNILFIIGVSIIFLGCSNKYPHLDTVKNVDIQKYKGTWYEIARFEHFFEKGCKNVTATYELKNDGDIKVINSCVNIDDNSKKQATGVVFVADETNSKLRVSFFRPFYGDYWILDLDKDYTYALVGTPSREYLWILSRTKTIPKNIKQKLVNKISKLGFEKQKLIWTIQE